MKKVILSILVLALLGGAFFVYMRYFYVEDPRDAFLRTATAAMLGDETGFLDGFTEESRRLVAGLLNLSRGDDVKTSSRHPYYHLVTEQIEDVTIEGDNARLTVRRQGDKSTGGTYDIPLKKIDNKWLIDAIAFTGKKIESSAAR